MIALLLLTTALCGVPQDTLSPAARRILADVQFLAADNQEGRGVGTAGLQRAGAYIRDGLARVGLLDSLNTPPRFDLRASGDGWGPSDHAVFFATRHPVLHFFTDLHEDYHRSTDDWDKLNVTGIAQVAQFVADLAWSLANRPGPLTFVDAPRPQATTGGSGYGAYLGTIPDMSGGGVSDGVRITGVRAGSPAEQAGLQAGDVITAIGDKHIGNLYDMTDALRSHQAGDTVVIVSRRDSVERRATTVLGKRP